MPNPVIIAGAGVTGLMLAYELALRDVPVTVVEQLPEPTPARPGMAINATVVDLLQQRGLMESVGEHGFDFPAAHFAQLWLEPSRVPDLRQYNYIVAQSDLERVLAREAAGLGAEIRWGHEVVGFAQDDDVVPVRVRAAGAEHTLDGRFLVGCDGPGSTVRRLADIGFHGEDLPFRGIVGDVEVAEDSELLTFLGAREFVGGLLTAAPVVAGALRIMTAEFDVEPEDPAAPVSVDELRTCAHRLSGIDLGEVKPRWLRRWDSSTRQAERYRRRNVFLAGDAAHVHFPLGGQSMSTGIEDAVNLGWKLAAAVHGEAPEHLLDSYHTERWPVGERACQSTLAQFRLLHPLDRLAPLRRLMTELIELDQVNEFLVNLVYGLDVRYPLEYESVAEPLHPLVGRRISSVPLVGAAGETSLAQLLQPGRGVVVEFRDDGGTTTRSAEWLDRVDVVTVKPSPWIDASLILLRPDGRIAWAESADAAGGGADGLRAALTTWFGAGL
ncbi:FAD-dependent monooxygenase [Dactylosporangium sp. CA-233914]|uniref:FAD-dependent monooxygenase n=1 Tax=Dactylosporangium sp. CA-233914 TaxID=3239934 RepID=UPI003D8B190F